MMHVLMLTVVIMGVEAVEVKKRGVTFPGKKVSVNGTSSTTVSRPSSSVLDCGRKCLSDGDCVAANYEDAGVCHMLAPGPISLKNISMEDNTHTTAILPESLPESTSSANYVEMIGWWPLQEAYGGEDLSGHGNHMKVFGVSFPDDDVTPWASPAADFTGTEASYGYIQHGHHLDVRSFSWMAKVYPRDVSGAHLFQWRFNGVPGVLIYLYKNILGSDIYFPGCSSHTEYHPTKLHVNDWYTMAVTYDFPTNTLTLWLNGESHVDTEPACGTSTATSPELYIGKKLDDHAPFRGRLSCMSLYNSSEVEYDVMYAATMSHCGGE